MWFRVTETEVFIVASVSVVEEGEGVDGQIEFSGNGGGV